MINKNGIRVEVKKKRKKREPLKGYQMKMLKLRKGDEVIEIPEFMPLVNTLILENYEIILKKYLHLVIIRSIL